MERRYQICARCIMDTSDPDIFFDKNGICNHCHNHKRKMMKWVKTGMEEEEAINSLVNEIKIVGSGKKYDCIIGVSGGVDSTYVAYRIKTLGLNPLAVHLDNGWNSAESVTNIFKCLSRLDIDLHTEVLDWNEFRDLQLAFLRASTPDSEIPTDHAIGAVLLRIAAKHNLKHIIAGQNMQTEGLMPLAWSRGYHDWKYIESVHKIFGEVPLKTFPHYNVFEHIYFKKLCGIKRVDILNWMSYDRQEAKSFLQREFGWEDYGAKHHESIYTRFYQTYILPLKFGFDKRRAHLSNLVSAGSMTRDQALIEIQKPPSSPEQLEEDKIFVIKKLETTEEEFDLIMKLPPKTILDYPSYERSFLYQCFLKLYHIKAGQADAVYFQKTYD